MYICMCNKVKTAKLKEKCDKIGDDVDKILKKTRAGSACGKCIVKVLAEIDNHFREKEGSDKNTK